MGIQYVQKSTYHQLTHPKIAYLPVPQLGGQHHHHPGALGRPGHHLELLSSAFEESGLTDFSSSPSLTSITSFTFPQSLL